MKKFLLPILFLLAFLERVVFDLGPNVELLTMALIVSSIYFNKKQTFYLVFSIIALSDLMLGNTSIFLFTWSGFLIPALFMGNILNNTSNNKYFFGTIMGISSNIFFYLWTNFGVWALDTWGMYPKTLSGLIMSYINGLPFLKTQFLSTIVFVPLGIFFVEILLLISKRVSILPKLDWGSSS